MSVSPGAHYTTQTPPQPANEECNIAKDRQQPNEMNGKITPRHRFSPERPEPVLFPYSRFTCCYTIDRATKNCPAAFTFSGEGSMTTHAHRTNRVIYKGRQIIRQTLPSQPNVRQTQENQPADNEN